MGPLTPNIYESTLATIPSLIIAGVVSALFPLPPKEVAHVIGQTPFQHAWLAEINSIAPSVNKIVGPFIVPLILLCSAIVMGWATLESFDSKRMARKRSRNGFLYLDGAYGLLPQTLLATGIGLIIVSVQHDWFDNHPILFLYVAALILPGLILQTILLLGKFPDLMFSLNGYGSYGSPRTRYMVAAWILNPLCVYSLLAALFVLQVAMVMGVAYARVWLRFHFGRIG